MTVPSRHGKSESAQRPYLPLVLTEGLSWYGIEAKKGLFACEFGSGTCEVKFSEFERNVNVDDVVEEVGSILCTANTLAGGECAGDS